jgi:rhodanese-related sulfurtransferase
MFFVMEVIMRRGAVQLIMGILFLLVAVAAGAAEYTIVDAAQFKGWLNDRKPMILADIQKPDSFKKHHFYGAVETNASPAKTEKETGKLDVIVRKFQKTGKDVVVIGSRGGASARRTAAYLIDRGIPADKVFILDGGVKYWPDREMLLDVAGGCT